MLEGAEAARRRELQLRAYAPGGSLTDAEAAELRDLDSRNLTAPVVAPPIPGPAPTRDDAFRAAAMWAESSPEPRWASSDMDPEQPDADPDPARVPAASARRRFPQRLVIPVIAIVAVVLGLVAGRLVFGEHTPMTAAQQTAWAKLDASGIYVPGSIHLAGSRYETDAWTAKRAGGALECLILTRDGDTDDGSGAGCVNPDDPIQGDRLQANLSYTEKEIQYSVWATVMDDINGNPAIVMQRQNLNDGFDWRAMYDESELPMVDVLVAAGFEGQSLNIVGYDGETPVWTGQNGQQTCVAVVQDGGLAQACGLLVPGRDPLRLSTGETTYSVAAATDRGDTLTIYRHGAGVQG